MQWRKREKYQRIVGKVLLDGQDINLEQVRRGMAWHYKAFEREQTKEERRTYAEAGEQARNAQLGLWADKSPVPPWEFRRAAKPKRDEDAGSPAELGAGIEAPVSR